MSSKFLNISIDSNLGTSDEVVSSQNAIKTYVDNYHDSTKQDVMSDGTGIKISSNAINILQADEGSTTPITVNGSPTYNASENSYTGFNNNSTYLSIPDATYTFASTPNIEIVLKIKTPSTINSYTHKQLINAKNKAGSSNNNMIFAIRANGILRMQWNGSSVSSSTNTLSASTTYWLKYTLDNVTSNTYVSTDGSTWENWASTTFSSATADDIHSINLCYPYTTDSQRFADGVIYLNDCYIKVDGETVWAGAGIPTKSVAKATSSLYGLIKPDTTTITVDNGVITASSLSGLTATVSELNYVDGVTSNIQTQLDGKQATISNLSTIESNATNGQSAYTTISGYGDIVTHNTSEFATSSQGTLADTALQPNDNISELTNDSGYITSSGSITGSSGSCTGNSATATTLQNLTANIDELNYCDGVTSNIQTQLNAKLETDHSNDTKPYLKTTYKSGTSGYNIWSNGYCEQWGYVTTTGTVTYLKTFNDADYDLQITYQSSYTSAIRGSYSGYNSKTATGFTHTTDSNDYKNWKASGYLAEGEY